MGIVKNNSVSDIFQKKNLLRTEFLHRRLKLTNNEIITASHHVIKILESLDFLKPAKKIVAYSAFKNEIDLDMFYKTCGAKQIDIFLPRYHKIKDEYVLTKFNNQCSDLVCGKYQVLEPTDSGLTLNIKEASLQIGAWLVPGLAFSRKGYRLGYGKGYYDHFLKNAKGLKIGIGYSWQLVEDLPFTHNDIPLDYLILENEVVKIFCKD